MGNFPFISAAPETGVRSLPIFAELAYDYGNNCLLKRAGKPYLVYKDAAIQIWIYKTLKTGRYIYPAYTHAYGHQLENIAGMARDREIVESEIRRYIIEALMASPYIQELDGFTFEWAGGRVRVTFTVTTVYGRITWESELYNE